MRKRLLNLMPGFVLLFAFTTASVPVEKADAAATSRFSQVILEPDCYDYVSTVSGTIDYIATFECDIRRPDGTALDGYTMPQGTVSLR
jgi:hypothetical protein